MKMASLLGLGMMKHGSSRARWSPNERTRETEETSLCFFSPFHQRSTVTEPRGGFSLQLRGLFELDLLLIEMNRPNITTPYNSILGTDGRVIWEDTFSNPPSSHVLWHSGMSEREERGWQRPMTLRSFKRIHMHSHTHTHTHIHTHTHTQRFIREEFVTLSWGGQTDFTVDRRMRSKTTVRCRGECLFSFTSHPANAAAGCPCQRSACQT